MNINSTTSIPYTQSDNTLQSRPVDSVKFPAQNQNSEEQADLSERARMLQRREMRDRDLVDSLEDKLKTAEEEEASDENIRVTSSIGRQKTADNLTKTEAVDLYRSIQNLL